MSILNTEDTICQVATSLNKSGIAVIRISGNDAINIASKILCDKNKNKLNIEEDHKIKYGYVYDNDNFIDEVMVLTFLAPRSYTKENVIEIQTHGNNIIIEEILRLLTKNGCRLAEAGEFTKRAFLNGRIDLSKAEAVMDLINSKTEIQRKTAFSQLKGNIHDEIINKRAEILETIAFIEACLDDPEHVSVDEKKEEIIQNINNIKNDLIKTVENAKNRKIIKEGINTVILGKPNVGKSSLLNLLLNEERAIVTDIEGTTRDTIKESIDFNGIVLNIIDTAGIREEENINEVEKIGIKKSKIEANNADLILYLLDGTKIKNDLFSNEDINIINNINQKQIIFVINKTDLINDKDFYNKTNFLIEKNKKENYIFIYFSTKTNEGQDELKQLIKNLFINNKIDFNDELIITNDRHIELLNKTINSLNNTLNSIKNELSEDFWTIDMTDAYTYLSNILGEEISDDIINEIFSKFCMGK